MPSLSLCVPCVRRENRSNSTNTRTASVQNHQRAYQCGFPRCRRLDPTSAGGTRIATEGSHPSQPRRVPGRSPGTTASRRSAEAPYRRSSASPGRTSSRRRRSASQAPLPASAREEGEHHERRNTTARGAGRSCLIVAIAGGEFILSRDQARRRDPQRIDHCDSGLRPGPNQPISSEKAVSAAAVVKD